MHPHPFPKSVLRLLSLGLVTVLLGLSACTPGRVGFSSTPSPAPAINATTAVPILPTGSLASPLVTESPPATGTMPITQAEQVKPQPGDGQLARGEAFVDSAQVSASPDQAGTALVSLKGSLPTPCHQLRAQINLPDAHDRIAIEVYSVFDSNRICAQMIVLFDLLLPVGGLSLDREYTVAVNGQDMLRFQLPLP